MREVFEKRKFFMPATIVFETRVVHQEKSRFFMTYLSVEIFEGFQKKPTHWDVRLESKLICGIRSVCKIVKLTLEVCLYFQ